MSDFSRAQQVRDAGLRAGLQEVLDRHRDVAGASVGYTENYKVSSVTAGFARVSSGEAMTPEHYLECASLSKTVGTAFAIEYFTNRGIPMTTSANSMLERSGSSWRITFPPGKHMPANWLDKVTLAMLVNHTALGMHYVYGVPLDHQMPSSREFVDGSVEKKYGYAPLYLEREPGTQFKYSGGGYIVMQHLLESLEGDHIENVIRPFLDRNDMQDFSFLPTLPAHAPAAFGHFTRDKEVQPSSGGRLAFPALAAGGLCTTRALTNFLNNLSLAYQYFEDGSAAPLNAEGACALPISPATAGLMLGPQSLVDLGCMDFMRSKMGLGVFVATAGPNKLMLHQAANEGFRGVYFVCFSGPDRGTGFLLLCNGDNPAVLFQSDASRFLLGPGGLNIRGVDFSRISNFSMEGLKQEEIVNLGLKELVLAGFADAEEMKSKL